MIPYILLIESSTTNCSVAICRGETICSFLEKNESNYTHAEKLHLMISEVLEKSFLKIEMLDAIAVSSGPGSYTGLRIGVATAKGLCFALKKPLIAVPTLEALAHTTTIDEGYIIPILDARSMGVYAEVYDHNFSKIEKTQRIELISNVFSRYYEQLPSVFIGTGIEMCENTIKSTKASFIKRFPSSKHMAKLAYKRLLQNEEGITEF